VDRVFTARGAGTVVTGTLTGGALAVDDEVLAGGHPARVRAVESAGRRAERAEVGARVALNLAGVEHGDLRRGDAVVRPGQWATPTVVDVAVTTLAGDETKRRRRLHAAVGSGEHRAIYRPLDDGAHFARLRLEAPLPLAPGDRLVLRDLGRRRTVAGVEVLDVQPARRAKDAPARLGQPLGERLLAASPWLATDEMARAGGLSAGEAKLLGDDLVASGVAIRRDGWLVDPEVVAAIRAAALDRVREQQRAHPGQAGLDLAGVAASLRVTPTQVRAALDGDSELVVERGAIRDRSQTDRAAASPDGRRVVEAFEAAGFAPPRPSEVGDPGVVRALVREGALVDVDGVVFGAGALDAARRAVVEALQRQPRLTVADIRDLLGSTRKFVVPICGWLDRQGVTRRRGDDRIPGPASGLAG
jgi:selenocysteine-specific elongation factor